MTEKSWPWDTVSGLGDGSAELNEALSREFLALYFGVQNPSVEGVCKGVAIGELEVSGVATPLLVKPGAAICYGLYISDNTESLAIVTPAIGTTGGRVVLQTNWAGTGGAPLEARTRLAVKYSADGVPAIPALTQAFGTTWEISLATFTVTTGGVIAVTDDRTFRRSTAMVDTDEITDLAVTTAKIENLNVTTGKIAANAVDNTKIRDSAALSVIGRELNSAGDPADIAAGVDGYVLRRSGTTLTFGQVATAGISNLAVSTDKLANDSVDDTKAGNRVPQMYRRQGGSATSWSLSGSATYTPGAVRIQCGAHVTDGSGDRIITFPVAFAYQPLVILTVWNNGTGTFAQICLDDVSATTLTVESFDAAGSKVGGIYFNWMAIGTE